MTRGERIRSRRQALGLTLDELAKQCGTIKTTIYKYEHGKVDQIPPARMESLARALKTTPEWLSGWTDEEEYKAYGIDIQHQGELDQIISQLSPAGMERLLEYARDLQASGRYGR